MFSLLVLGGSSALAISFPLSEVIPGLTGYGVTAGPGNVLEQFDVEVLGIQQDVGLGFPLVLVRTGGELIKVSGGVAAGMSGSPVYIEREGEAALLGAVGYVFPESDHQLALVTPIAAMRGEEISGYTPSGAAHFAAAGQAVAVRTPLLLAGLSERAGEPLNDLFAPSPVTPLPVQLGGVGGFNEAGYELQPGSAVSVQLVRGDITVAAVGTVTAVEGGDVLAFGHPLVGEGEVSFALAPAFVSYIVPSDVVPFKLANNGETLLGTITQDRPAALAGRLEQPPDFLPVTLTLVGAGETVTKNFEVTADERYYAPLLASAVTQLFDEARGAVGAGTAELAWEITLADGEKVRVLEQVSDPDDIVGVAADLAASPLSILAENIFAAPEIASVDINLTFDDEQRYAEVVEVVAESEELDPGKPLVARVRLQPYRGSPEVKTLTVNLPEETDGDLDITIRGGLEPAPDTGDEEDDEPVLSFAELLVVLHDQVQARELVVETFVEGERVRLERLKLPYLVSGEETLTVTVGGKVETPEDEDVEDDVEPETVPEPDEDLPDPTDPAPPLEPSHP